MAGPSGYQQQRAFIISDDQSRMRRAPSSNLFWRTDRNATPHLQVKPAQATLDEVGLAETVEELKSKLEAMRQLIESDSFDKDKMKLKRRDCGPTAITGNFLSVVFIIVLITVVLVSGYAFTSLAVAVRKKYPGSHSEL